VGGRKMKLTSQEEYGLRCLVQLGRHTDGRVLTIPELSRLEGISVPHVAKIMRVLRRAGFVRSTRGQSGGYTLARRASQIAVGEALAALGGRLYDGSFCQRHGGSLRTCMHLSDCSIRPVWQQVQELVDEVLSRLTLEHLLGSEQEMSARATSRAVPLPMYPVSHDDRP
jgi:Rrf2 family protein